MDKVASNVPLSPNDSQASVKWLPKPNNKGKIIMQLDQDEGE